MFYDVNAGVGGPIASNRLWFFGSARRFRVDRFEASTFNPDGTQALDENLIWNASGKLTWQINPANRLSGFVDYNYKVRDHRRQTTAAYQFVSPDASYDSPLWASRERQAHPTGRNLLPPPAFPGTSPVVPGLSPGLAADACHG